jgi:hypothetical protein
MGHDLFHAFGKGSFAHVGLPHMGQYATKGGQKFMIVIHNE